MKKIILFISCVILISSSRKNDNEIPPTNKKVVEFVKTVIHKKVGRGECWDLANEALKYANAKWEPPFGFGEKIDYKKDKIFPGDLIQLKDVTMESRKGNSITRWKMTKHTAILYETNHAFGVTGENGKVMIAEQNVDGVRTVQINEWNLDDLKSGDMQFFRPQGN